jgi:hypothetical protein
VSASTQNQALCALVFLYKQVLANSVTLYLAALPFTFGGDMPPQPTVFLPHEGLRPPAIALMVAALSIGLGSNAGPLPHPAASGVLGTGHAKPPRILAVSLIHSNTF